MAWVGSYLWRLRQKIGHELVLMPGASVLITNMDGQILLTERSDSQMWCMPGGAAEEGSDFLTTAIDELREEIGVEISPNDLTAFACISGVENHLLTYPNGDQTHCFALWFVLENWVGQPKTGDEVRQVRFFYLNDVPPNTLKPSLVAIELYKQYKKTGKFQVA